MSLLLVTDGGVIAQGIRTITFIQGSMKMKSQKGDQEKAIRVAPEGLESSVPKRIARRAYELYLERGGASGNEIDDWLQAEREIQQEKRY